MCGIAGFYSKNNFVSDQDLRQMTTALAHRGPDAEGFYQYKHIGLGHKRLKILDLSDRANQPYHSADDRYVMVYNGEVYNYEEIAANLGLETRTTSDTEVVLEAFARKGPNCVLDFNGMFAFVIFDKKEETLHIFRDRVGIKPLYYYWDGKNYAFASELKSLLKIKAISDNLEIHYDIIGTYLHLGYIPEPHTIYKNIYKFPSGHSALLTDGKMETKEYWSLNDQLAKEPIHDLKIAKEEFRTLLSDSVSKRLKSDMPYGVFLSGGTDSSLIAAIAQSVTTSQVKTFTIGFKESEFNEAKHAKTISRHLDTNHHELILSQREAKELVGEMIDVYDEPYFDSSAIPTMLVSKMASESVSVTLSGDGGDELFMGYGSYLWAERLSNPLVKLLRTPIGYVLSKLNNRSKRAAHHFAYSETSDLKSQIFAQEQYLFSISEINEMLLSPSAKTIKLESSSDASHRNLTPGEHQALFDIRYYLKDDLLVKVDRASMLHSLETRVPLLDHRIIEFALGLDLKFKQYGGESKILLKSLLHDFIPREYLDRPKQGFSIPMIQWLKDDLSYLIEDFLSKEVLDRIGVVKNSVVQDLIFRFQSGEDYLFNRIWCLIILHKFFSK